VAFRLLLVAFGRGIESGSGRSLTLQGEGPPSYDGGYILEQFDAGEVLRVDEADGVVAAVDDDQVADAMGLE
jgi:hypothetical protein